MSYARRLLRQVSSPGASPLSAPFLVSDTPISFSLFKAVFRGTLKTDDEAEIEKVVRSSSLWAFVRLIGQMKKKPLSDKDKAAVELLTEKVRSLID